MLALPAIRQGIDAASNLGEKTRKGASGPFFICWRQASPARRLLCEIFCDNTAPAMSEK